MQGLCEAEEGCLLGYGSEKQKAHESGKDAEKGRSKKGSEIVKKQQGVNTEKGACRRRKVFGHAPFGMIYKMPYILHKHPMKGKEG